jgi:hypothetical protein
MCRPAPLVLSLAALLAAFGPPALAQDSGGGIQPRAPWAAPGADTEPAPDATRFPRVAPEPPAPAPVAQEAPAPQDAQDQPLPSPPPGEERRLRTWELPTLEVVGSGLKEEERVGSYRQPRWSVERLFPTTRIYVLPEGAVHGEYWSRIEEPRHGETRYRDYYEIEFGLPNRFQLDFYLVADHTGEWEPGAINQQMVEGRYAFADWDEIWGNPTIYAEYIHRNDDPDSIESKLLLGGEAGPGWHWGTNLSIEQETSGEEERELQLAGGLSRTVIDDKFALGVEGKAQQTDEKDSRSDNEHSFGVGPSMRWLPTDRVHVDFTPLWGIGPDSPRIETYLIVGMEF